MRWSCRQGRAGCAVAVARLIHVSVVQLCQLVGCRLALPCLPSSGTLLSGIGLSRLCLVSPWSFYPVSIQFLSPFFILFSAKSHQKNRPEEKREEREGSHIEFEAENQKKRGGKPKGGETKPKGGEKKR